MSENMAIWIIGSVVFVLGGWNVILTGWMFRIWTMAVRFDATLISISDKAAVMLHSPNDHYGIDKLLEKYVDNHYDLTYQEWQDLFKKCDEIMADKSISDGHRVLAMFVKELSTHKMTAWKK